MKTLPRRAFIGAQLSAAP